MRRNGPNIRKVGYTFIPSVYERNNYEIFLKTTAEEGNLLYWDKKRMSLPGALTRAAIIGNDIPIIKITTKEDVVKANKSALAVISGKTRQHQGEDIVADLTRFVKRKIAKYNNCVSGQGPGVLFHAAITQARGHTVPVFL